MKIVRMGKGIPSTMEEIEESRPICSCGSRMDLIDGCVFFIFINVWRVVKRLRGRV